MSEKQYTKDQLNEIVSRVTAEVTTEVSAGEAAFKVSDLRAQFSDLVRGGESAWTISYSTVSAELGKTLGREAAWTISYSTAGVTMGAKTAAR